MHRCICRSESLLRALLVQPLQELRRKVRKDDRSTSADKGLDGLKGHGLEVVNALFGASNDHRVLAGDLIDGGRVVGLELRAVRHNVQVWEGGLDHEDVGSLGSIALLKRQRRRQSSSQ